MLYCDKGFVRVPSSGRIVDSGANRIRSIPLLLVVVGVVIVVDVVNMDWPHHSKRPINDRRTDVRYDVSL